MMVRLGLLALIIFGALVAYLTTLNPSSVRIALAPHAVYDPPLMAVVSGAFLAGAGVTLLFAFLREVGRSFKGLDRRAWQAPPHLRATGAEPRSGAPPDLTAERDQAGRTTDAYQIGKALLAEGKPREALRHFREAVRHSGEFLPALVAVGDAHEVMGDSREAVRAWERAAESTPALALLQRLERAYRAEGRPTRMIALYQTALARSPDDLPLAFALGRVLFELGMLDEAADQFQKVEVEVPDLPPVHAYLGVIFERRGQDAEALEEYRRALRLADRFEWPHICSACGAAHVRWQDRCPSCGQWNTSTPKRR